jgi:FSR family fosmidomycin resistance protein-like MFS transporter
MGFTLVGLLSLSVTRSYPGLILSAGLVGLGSAVFHPESSRVARMASGGRHGFAQSLFQVGGNTGSAIGPLVAAFVVLPRGQGSIAWFSLAALVAMAFLWHVGTWYKASGAATPRPRGASVRHHAVSSRQVVIALLILLALIFSKYIYLASITNYYPFYLMERFGLTVRVAQLYQFVFFAAVATGTILGGPIGDRVGRKRVIWASILGVLPFTLALPHVGLGATVVLSVIIGVVISSAFPAIVVYAQELIPGRTGMVSGVFFGLAFGIGGIGAALLGGLADRAGIGVVYQLCAFLPAIGLLTALLPGIERPAHDRA